MLNGQPYKEPITTTVITKEAISQLIELGTGTLSEDTSIKHRVIPFNTIEIETPSLEKGQRRVIQTGINGKVRYTTTQKLLNGAIHEEPKVTREVIQEVVDEIVEVGTRERTELIAAPVLDWKPTDEPTVVEGDGREYGSTNKQTVAQPVDSGQNGERIGTQPTKSELPPTGEVSMGVGLGFTALVAGTGLAIPRRRREDE